MKTLGCLFFAVVILSCAGTSKKENLTDLVSERKGAVKENITDDDDELLGFTVYGRSHLAMIPLPKTWTVDLDFARQLDIAGFFYMNKYAINDAPSGILLTLVDKPNDDAKLEDYIFYDFNNYTRMASWFHMEQLDWNIVNKNDYKLMTYCISHNELGFLQYAAYFDVGLHYFVKLTLAVHDENELGEALNDFKRCLKEARFSDVGLVFQ